MHVSFYGYSQQIISVDSRFAIQNPATIFEFPTCLRTSLQDCQRVKEDTQGPLALPHRLRALNKIVPASSSMCDNTGKLVACGEDDAISTG